MELLIPIALYGWIPIALVIFREVRGYRALVVAYVAGWLFLPTAEILYATLPDYTKIVATAMGTLLAIVLFESRELTTFRPRWPDFLMLVFCLSPMPSAISNSLGLWDGISNSLNLTFLWGLPYLFGRIYITSLERLRFLALGIFVGGLVYVPLCLFEMRMSPQLHLNVYGVGPNILYALRGAGWRPIVFTYNGLELGMWMSAAVLMGFALWYSGSVKKLFGLPMELLLLGLLGTTILCRSMGALVLLVVGVMMVWLLRQYRHPWPVLVLLLVPITYVSVRSTGLTDGSEAVELADRTFGPVRAQSLEFRFQNETMLINRALEAPWFGWGGWGREQIKDEYGEPVSICDGMWIITFGIRGFFGLAVFLAAFLVPVGLAATRFCRRRWRREDVVLVSAVAVLVGLYMVDCLLNSMGNPLYAICVGALVSLAAGSFSEVTTASAGEEADPQPVPRVRGRLWPPLPPQPWQESPPAEGPASPVIEPAGEPEPVEAVLPVNQTRALRMTDKTRT